MSENQDIVKVFREAAKQVAGNNLDGLTLDTRLTDLQLDSVSTMEVIGLVEEQLHVRFDDSDLSRLNTVRDLSALVEKARARS
jgi:acyl carrier protein